MGWKTHQEDKGVILSSHGYTTKDRQKVRKGRVGRVGMGNGGGFFIYDSGTKGEFGLSCKNSLDVLGVSP